MSKELKRKSQSLCDGHIDKKVKICEFWRVNKTSSDDLTPLFKAINIQFVKKRLF
jgi:hypothetical protein